MLLEDGGEIASVDDYICDECGEPLIRFEDNSIMELYVDGDARFLHKSCVDRIIEEICQGKSRYSLTP
jgi:hypothetical protein